jgi:hypothetical protein
MAQHMTTATRSHNRKNQMRFSQDSDRVAKQAHSQETAEEVGTTRKADTTES